MFEALSEEKAMKLDAIMMYRSMPKKFRDEAAILFTQSTGGREADLKYSESQLKSLLLQNQNISGEEFDALSKEDKAYHENEQKLDDLYMLFAISEWLKENRPDLSK